MSDERTIDFADFRQVVRRHRPSDLLPALAGVACRLGEPPYDWEVVRRVGPWAVAVAARESILWGNEYRKEDVTEADLRNLFNAYNDIYEYRRSENKPSPHVLLTRLAYEQFPYQESLFEEVTRAHAMLIEGLNHVDAEVLDEAAWNEILGAPLGQIVGATFLLQVAANKNNGWFDDAWLERGGIPEFFELWPKDVITHRASQLSQTSAEFKEDYASVPAPPIGHERYAYNPLLGHPFVRMHDNRLLAPQPRLILRTVSPGALYYPGIKRFGDAFARDLGRLTERYVGEQLKTVEGAEVHGEVTYSKPEKKSVDWFLVLPEVVVMFEVKSARPGVTERAAVSGFEDRVRRVLNRAVGQLIRTKDALDRREAAFGHIPDDRPTIGMVVTAEPYYLANTPWVRDLLPSTTFPTLVASLRDLERLVTLPAEVIEKHLSEIANDPERRTWNLSVALADVKTGKQNTILQQAWDAYPWPSPTEELGQERVE